MNTDIGRPRFSILLAEDNDLSQKLTIRILEKEGHSVIVACDGQEALEILSLCPDKFALILMDCQMPNVDGYQATRIIREREMKSGATTRKPIIALTANASEGDRQRCIDCGMDDYIAKPINVTELKQKVQYWGANTLSSPAL